MRILEDIMGTLPTITTNAATLTDIPSTKNAIWICENGNENFYSNTGSVLPPVLINLTNYDAVQNYHSIIKLGLSTIDPHDNDDTAHPQVYVYSHDRGGGMHSGWVEIVKKPELLTWLSNGTVENIKVSNNLEVGNDLEVGNNLIVKNEIAENIETNYLKSLKIENTGTYYEDKVINTALPLVRQDDLSYEEDNIGSDTIIYRYSTSETFSDINNTEEIKITLEDGQSIILTSEIPFLYNVDVPNKISLEDGQKNASAVYNFNWYDSTLTIKRTYSSANYQQGFELLSDSIKIEWKEKNNDKSAILNSLNATIQNLTATNFLGLDAESHFGMLRLYKNNSPIDGFLLFPNTDYKIAVYWGSLSHGNSDKYIQDVSIKFPIYFDGWPRITTSAIRDGAMVTDSAYITSYNFEGFTHYSAVWEETHWIAFGPIKDLSRKDGEDTYEFK